MGASDFNRALAAKSGLEPGLFAVDPKMKISD
jgi:hypothetical protein